MLRTQTATGRASLDWSANPEQEHLWCGGNWNTQAKDHWEQGSASTSNIPGDCNFIAVCCGPSFKNCQKQIKKAAICNRWCWLSNQWHVLVTYC